MTQCTRIDITLCIEGYVLMGVPRRNQDIMDYQRETTPQSSLNNNKSKMKPLVLPRETVHTLYKLPVNTFSIFTVSLPLLSLIFCFITACIFQHELVTETECHVSISGIHDNLTFKMTFKMSFMFDQLFKFAQSLSEDISLFLSNY